MTLVSTYAHLTCEQRIRLSPRHVSILPQGIKEIMCGDARSMRSPINKGSPVVRPKVATDVLGSERRAPIVIASLPHLGQIGAMTTLDFSFVVTLEKSFFPVELRVRFRVLEPVIFIITVAIARALFSVSATRRPDLPVTKDSVISERSFSFLNFPTVFQVSRFPNECFLLSWC